jgi:hypothetical protein
VRPLLLATLALVLAGCAPAGVGAPPPLEVVRGPLDCERLEYTLVQDGTTLGSGTLTSSPGRGAQTWVLTQTYESAVHTERTDESTVTVGTDLAPVSSHRTIAQMGNVEEVRAEYGNGEGAAVVMLTRSMTGREADDPGQLRLRNAAYDNESAFWLWRVLPLEEGYRARYTSVNAYERSQATVDLSVVDVVQVPVPAGTFETWRVLVVAGRATRTAWIEVAAPHRLIQWDNGVSFMRLVRDSSSSFDCAGS